MTARNAWFEDPDFTATTLASELRRMSLGFVDVGVRGGVHELVEPIAQAISVLAFDPDPAACDELTGPGASLGWGGYDIVPAGLAQQAGQRTLHLLSAPTNHSLLPPNEAFTGRYQMVKHVPVGQMTVPTLSLDEAIIAGQPDRTNGGEFLKLDTQGSEYEILCGARQVLADRTVAAVVEVEFCEVYSKQKLFSDIEILLREMGFSFYSFTKLYYRSRKQLDKRVRFGRERLLCADAVFFKDPLPGGPGATMSRRGHYALTASALLLGYYDFALELSLATWADTPQDAAHMRAFVERLAEHPPAATVAAIDRLATAARERPADANLLAVRFADAYRTVCDMDDVLT